MVAMIAAIQTQSVAATSLGYGTQTEFPQVCVHELFERQVDRDPGATAVVFEHQRFSYRELNERANKVAHYLRKRGVGPDVLVGVCIGRTPALVVALLAVWKAGGAYVPLDPAYPAERLSFMIRDAETQLLLTEDNCRHLLPAIGDRVICLDSDWTMLDREPAGNPAPLATPTDLAYVMYTSGSTGWPKGAMITHRGLVNYLWWAIKAYAVEAGCSVPVHSSISFDLTVTGLYPPLLVGGVVELLAEDIGAQNLLAALLRARDRNLVKITPAHLELLNQQISREQAAGITRLYVIGGENLLAENLRLWRDLTPATRLINEYGPTETVVGCCVHEVQPSDPHIGSIPIGGPIANTQLHVLDTQGAPAPIGEVGELYIGGAGVARGYYNRPELTAERFPVDPFSSTPGARMYKTGDMVRYRADGILEYLGRADDQVKILGYRIELGEIEAALVAHPEVQSCTVVAREDQPGVKQLVGYVVPVNPVGVNAEVLNAFLVARLPAYMVPAHLIALPALPLTPNGKVDRSSLPAPSAGSSVGGRGGPPRTLTEQAVAKIWSELLKSIDIGIEDDFFDVGGRSMTATALVSRLHTTFAVDFRLASLFERPTIAGIAEVVDMLALTRRKANSPATKDREEFVL